MKIGDRVMYANDIHVQEGTIVKVGPSHYGGLQYDVRLGNATITTSELDPSFGATSPEHYRTRLSALHRALWP